MNPPKDSSIGAIVTASNRPRVIAVVTTSCTGCQVCVDFCPVDCIDEPPRAQSLGEITPTIHIREEECVGCHLCAKVCDELEQGAIHMVAVGEFHNPPVPPTSPVGPAPNL